MGADTIKIAQVDKEKDSFKLVSAGMAKTPLNGLSSDSDKDLVAVAETIKKLKKEAKIESQEVALSLHEMNVFTQVFDFPKMSEEELNQAIPWEAENMIPKPLSEVNLDWEIIPGVESPGGKVKILLVASPTELVKKYLRIIRLADLVPVSLETEFLAIARCLKPISERGNFLAVNIGFSSTDIAVVRNNYLYTTRSLPSAGESISRSISAGLGLDLAVAEEYKKTYGLSPQLEGKVAGAIEPILAVILNEIKKAIRFYEEKEQESLKLVVLSGGTCLLPGFSEYLAKALGIEVQIADPLSLMGAEEQTRLALRSSSPIFTVAFGLAMRGG